MPPRIRLRSLAQLPDLYASKAPSTSPFVCTRCAYATAAPSPAPLHSQIVPASPPASRYSPNNPPSHRDPAYRKSQLLRSYVSLLQTTPLIILFQHNNLKAVEWASIRRELATALQKVDDHRINPDINPPLSDSIKLTVIRTNIFEPALRIAEYYKPDAPNAPAEEGARRLEDEKLDPRLTHALSRNAWAQAKEHHDEHPLSPLLAGPLAVLTFPSVSPAHVKAALSILSPDKGLFPAPTRRAAPGYHEPATQDGLKKLLLLGARIDGQVFDWEGVKWVGSIDGGIDGLRAQLVAMLQGASVGVVQTLEAASRSLWFTVEGRRRMLEDESTPKEEKKE